MNMMQDILAAESGIPQIPHMDLSTFARAFDSESPLLSLLRPPADVPIVGGMLPPSQAVKVLNAHGDWLRENYGHGYTAKLTSGNTVDDLIRNLKSGYPTTIHVSQPTNLFSITNGQIEWGDWRTLIGGAPHTVTLAGYDATSDTWLILDPAPGVTDYTRWHTSELMDKWGRQFVGYPPRFAMTTLIPDSSGTLPVGPSTASATPAAPSPTSSATPGPSQTAGPPSAGTSTPPYP